MINSSECKVYKVIKDYFKNLKNKKDRKLNVYGLFLNWQIFNYHPYGNRTHNSTLRGWRLKPFDQRAIKTTLIILTVSSAFCQHECCNYY